MTEEIVALCKAMGADGDREELLLPLARAVVSAMEGRLRAGVTPADCGDAFPLAAAMVVMDGLEGATGTARGESRTDQAQRLLAPWLGETGFAFRGVAG